MLIANGPIALSDMLLIRLGNEPYMVLVTEDAGGSTIERVELHGEVPTLWGWLRLWWKYRGVRARQDAPTAAIRVEQQIRPVDGLAVEGLAFGRT